MTVRCFLPCRKGSERVPRKNIRPFAEFSGGLLEIKLKQLLESKVIEEVVLSTNDEEILDFAISLSNERLRVHRRDERLCMSETSTDDLVGHAVALIPEGHILWTHVTSPFLSADIYDLLVGRYLSAIEDGYDSLMTTTLTHGFFWDESGPVNYDRKHEKWPRTQTIQPLHEVNSAVFLSSADNYRNLGDRIGAHPLLYPLDKIAGFDVDWPEDFALGECIVKSGLAKL